jgi:2,3-dihydroxybiphenyl 1,2-dioxygenase
VHHLELGYIGLEVDDPEALGGFLTDVVGLVPGAPTTEGDATWRNDGRAHRILARRGPGNDVVAVGFEAPGADAFASAVDRLSAAGYDVVGGTPAELAARRVADLAHTVAPWGARLELVHGLACAGAPFASPLVPGGFLTEGVGFGHVVVATTAFDDAHRFVTEGLGLVQTDWLATEVAPGVELEVRFYHCNARHHSLAVARAPFALPQTLHHVMVEARDRDDVGRAFDRAWNAEVAIANGLGRHDNDGMFSFYAVSPAGFQVEFGHGARVVGDDWDDDRRYDRVSRWGHQPVTRG